MKKASFTKLYLLPSLLLLGGVAINASAVKEARLFAASSNYTAVSAGALPTTIDLNAVMEDDIRSYYSSLDGKNLNGDDLLAALKPILKQNQRYYSYDSGDAIWKIYEIADRDWAASPAKDVQTGNYDASANKITGYKYGKNYNNPKVHALYVNRDIENPMDAWSNHNQTPYGINREHIWPKSRGFDAEEVPGARGDPMHLWAADGYSNNIHNNLAYGFVDKSKDFLDTGDKEGFSYAKGNYKGTSLSLGSGTVFEPQDSDKGDIARACFYMVARYNNIAGDDDTIDAGNPNLTIANVNWSNSDTGTSTASQATEMGILKDLLAWHKMDPVDEYERTRNDLLYRNYTSNRNPFIDYPNWVEAIWGSVTLGSDLHSVASYDPTPNGKADPKNDKIYGDEAAPIPVSSNDPSTSSASSSEPSTPSDPSPSDNKTNLLGLPLPVLIGIAAASVVILILVIVIFSKASKKQRKAAKKAIVKAVKGSSKKSSSSKKKR